MSDLVNDSLRERIIWCIERVAITSNQAPEQALEELDSLALVELVATIEEELDVEIPDTRLNDSVFESVANLTVLVRNLQQGR